MHFDDNRLVAGNFVRHRVTVKAQGNLGWLGGLDSNQDIQIQSLVSYRLNDLPMRGKTEKTLPNDKLQNFKRGIGNRQLRKAAEKRELSSAGPQLLDGMWTRP